MITKIFIKIFNILSLLFALHLYTMGGATILITCYLFNVDGFLFNFLFWFETMLISFLGVCIVQIE